MNHLLEEARCQHVGCDQMNHVIHCSSPFDREEMRTERLGVSVLLTVLQKKPKKNHTHKFRSCFVAFSFSQRGESSRVMIR